MTTRAEEIAGEGPYTYRLSILVPDMCQIEDSEGNCVGLLRTPHDANTLCKELNIAYKQGQQDRWISVQERLPEPYQWVLVYSDTGDIGDFPYDIGRLVGKVWKCLGWDYPVTHWALLPPNPEQR